MEQSALHFSHVVSLSHDSIRFDCLVLHLHCTQLSQPRPSSEIDHNEVILVRAGFVSLLGSDTKMSAGRNVMLLSVIALILTLLDESHSLSTPVKVAPSTFSSNSRPTAIQPVDLILSSGFCAFARQAGDRTE